MSERGKRIHRVGTVTFGLCLVIFGVLFLLQMILPWIDCWMICRFWPVVLVVLGLEVLFSCKWENVIYDKWGIALLACLMVFSMGMGMLDMAGARMYEEWENSREISSMVEK